MASEDIFTIRKFNNRDRPSVRRICCQTGFMGKPSSIFFDDDGIFADAVTLYFTDYEPESCLVAELNGSVIGYLIGSKNIEVMNKVFLSKIMPGLLYKALFRGTLLKKKNIIFSFYFLRSLAKFEFRMPDFSKEYPATLHINIDKEYRAQGIGSRIISEYLAYLKKEKIRGVHFATFSEKANVFFAKRGFNLLFQGKRSYFENILHKDIVLYVFGTSFNSQN